jgi:hypothetical protein
VGFGESIEDISSNIACGTSSRRWLAIGLMKRVQCVEGMSIQKDLRRHGINFRETGVVVEVSCGVDGGAGVGLILYYLYGKVLWMNSGGFGDLDM